MSKSGYLVTELMDDDDKSSEGHYCKSHWLNVATDMIKTLQTEIDPNTVANTTVALEILLKDVAEQLTDIVHVTRDQLTAYNLYQGYKPDDDVEKIVQQVFDGYKDALKCFFDDLMERNNCEILRKQ